MATLFEWLGLPEEQRYIGFVVECVVFPVVMAAVVVSELTFTHCTWRNRTQLDIATGRRAARSGHSLNITPEKSCRAGGWVQSSARKRIQPSQGSSAATVAAATAGGECF